MMNCNKIDKIKQKSLVNRIIENSDGLLRLGTKSRGVHRLQPGDLSEQLTNEKLLETLGESNVTILKIVKPNFPDSASGRFDTFYVKDEDNGIEVNFVVGRGENKGQKFERQTAEAIDLTNSKLPDALNDALIGMGLSIEDVREIEWAGKSNSKRKISLEICNVGDIIADFKIHLKNGVTEYISLKNKNGDTFGNYGYNDGFTVINGRCISTESYYDDFIVGALGVDKELLSNSITDILNLEETKNIDETINVQLSFNQELLQRYLAGAYGCGYWYVRQNKDRTHQVLKIGTPEDALDLVGDIKSVIARYPRFSNKKSRCSKQLQVSILTSTNKFVVELRHSHRGVKPNELKIKSVGNSKR